MTFDPRITPLGLLGSRPAYHEIGMLTMGSTSSTGLPIGSSANTIIGWVNGPTTTPDDTEPAEDSETNDPSPYKKLNRLAKGEQDPTVTVETYFEFVKGSMTQFEQDDLRARLANLTATLQLAPREQLALREETQRLIAVAVLQQKAAALGFNKAVTREAIDKFRNKVELRRPELVPLHQFPRVIPAEPLAKFEKAKAAGIFSDFWVLTWNPTEEQVKSVTDRIISKDPIMFGTFSFDPDVYYLIADWIDETCDLTFSKMVDNLQELYPDFQPAEVKPLSPEDCAYIVAIAEKRAAMVKHTNSGRWRSDAVISNLEQEAFSWAKARLLLTTLFKQFRRRKQGNR